MSPSTIVAISLGAAFWFDTLKRFMNVRASGPAPHESKAIARKRSRRRKAARG